MVNFPQITHNKHPIACPLRAFTLAALYMYMQQLILSRCGVVMALMLVNVDSSNGLFPESTKPLSKPMMNYCQLEL